MPQTKPRKQQAPQVTRHTALRLWVVAGGRCSFPGCNKYLLTDDITNWHTVQGHIAHIVARTEGGARWNDPRPFATRSQIDNLMLVCPDHHHDIDDKNNEQRFPKELLLQYKREHERRIIELTGCKPDQQSLVLVLKSRIGHEPVSASYDQICEALFHEGRFPLSEWVRTIDFTQFRGSGSREFVVWATTEIRSVVERLYDGSVIERRPEHIAVFAIGEIPLLVYLGAQLSNKVKTDLFQRHIDTENWTWKDEPSVADYKTTMVREGTDAGSVALYLSLSGVVRQEDIPAHIDSRFFEYEIRLVGTPHREFLRTPGDLERFRSEYQKFLAFVRATHPAAQTIHLFPAIPAPVAVLCGRELLHKIAPSVTVYDSRKMGKEKGEFEFILEVD